MSLFFRNSSISPYRVAMILNALPNVGPMTFRKLSSYFKCSLPDILSANEKTINEINGITKEAKESLLNWEKIFDFEKEEKIMEKKGISFLPIFDDLYPEALKLIPDSPIGIYLRGNKNLLLRKKKIAIVGTRRASAYGTSVTIKIAGDLVKNDWVVVSGLALGIDTAAHKGALIQSDSTIAVLGSAVDIVYPLENVSLYEEIIEKGGLIISEYPIGRKADKKTFPMRNRIVAGLSEALLVVESDKRGGSMITANMAVDNGKIVFAMPGRVDQVNSRGCHDLIRNGAILATCATDIIEDMGGKVVQQDLDLGNVETIPKINIILEKMPVEAKKIYELLKEGDALSPDEIILKLDFSYPIVSSMLLLLELDNVILRKIDGKYEIKI